MATVMGQKPWAGRFEPVQGAGAASWDAGGREALHTVRPRKLLLPHLRHSPHLQAYSLPIGCPTYSVNVNRQCLCWTHRAAHRPGVMQTDARLGPDLPAAENRSSDRVLSI